ncbi:hypothetical protein J7I98_39295 [Streptomyces sp. ISL-98]|uniref:hypothetical protein n=1 Tax=Streptomyces sp. ISL-98 TaxID=2819192 RepID=UPI001BEB1AA9|nr:hypothetical protein [Streptomyces sp. ISL-98]MBT2511721.1 hypothetical protein [Streptomyces sp. ISL-98]
MVLHGAGEGCGQLRACALAGLGDLRDAVEEQQVLGSGVRPILCEVEEQPQRGAGEGLCIGDPSGQRVRAVVASGAQGTVQGKRVNGQAGKGLCRCRGIRRGSP